MNRNAGNYIRACHSVEDIRAALADARAEGITVVPRGGGFSQGAASNKDGIVLDLTSMDEVRIEYRSEREARAIVGPGATVNKLWRAAIEAGYWPEFLPTTPLATLGGCLAMSSYNAKWNGGAISEYVYGFDLLLSSNDLLSVSLHDNDDDLFDAVIGGMGVIGVVTSLSFRLRRIRSGRILVRQEPVQSFADLFGRFEEMAPLVERGYATAWINPYAQEGTTRFGSILLGKFFDEDDPTSLHPRRQGISSGVLHQILHPVLQTRVAEMFFRRKYPFDNHRFEKMMPIEKFHFFSPLGPRHHFLNNVMPQQCLFFRSIVRVSTASIVVSRLLELSHNAGLTLLWCTIKRHEPDKSCMLTPRVVGYLLELVYYIAPRNEAAVKQLLRELADVVIEAKGEISLDDSNALPAEIYRRSLGEERIKKFLELKRRYDSGGEKGEGMLFQSDLFRGLHRQ